MGVDCGAGIGRVTAGFLSTVCDVIDVVEPVQSFVEEVKNQKLGKGAIGELFVKGLEDWTPETGRYDLIWNQWCTGYLTDEHFVAYLRRCADAIKRPDGWIVVKENTSRDVKDGGNGKDVFDKQDSSVTRTNDNFLRIFKEAGVRVLSKETQKGFPKGLGLFPVRIYGLKPESQ